MKLIFVWAFFMLILNVESYCPKRCLCDRKMVRCMKIDMENIPLIPPEISILDLRYNKIRDIVPGVFSNLKQLTTLLLNNNKLITIFNGAFAGLFSLKNLSLYRNKISKIESGAFDGLEKLRQLYLHFNNLEYIDEDTFASLVSLERLFLHNNKIKRILPGTFDGLNNLQRLRLDGNAIICDCSVTWLMDMLGYGNITQAAATCGEPDNMKGLSLRDMNKKDLHCTEPIIKAGPEDIEVNFGGSAIFACQVAGDPYPEVIWMKDSNEIPYTDDRYHILDDGSLKIEKLNENDQGGFVCLAKNPMGETKSNVAKMKLISFNLVEGPPKFTVLPKDEVLKFGQASLGLSCSADGNPKPHISWSHNNHKLVLTSRIRLVNRTNLFIKNPGFENLGEYTCEAENIHGKIVATASIQTLSVPEITINKKPTSERYGKEFNLICETLGYPKPTITWYKDGIVLSPTSSRSVEQNKLVIKELKEDDTGVYLCRAENSEGYKEKTINVKVTKYNLVAPHLTLEPFDVEVFEGTFIELPCRSDGNPKPEIVWKKDGSNMFRTERHRISSAGSLFISNLTLQDNGRYECTATNDIGRASASAFLTVETFNELNSKPGDKFAKLAFLEATKEVDSAINKTVENLFNNNNSINKSIGELYRIIRYPNAADRELIRAGEIYERTLSNIRRYVNEGRSVNRTSDFDFEDLLSPEHSSLIAKWSGCIAHRRRSSCANMCFHSKYRTMDGTCNNFKKPTWGASNTGFRRILKPIYENGFNQPVGWNKNIKYNGFELPSARLVSTKLISTKQITPDPRITHMVMQWGQFLDHDLDHATPSVSSQSWDGIDCKRTCEYASPCFPIDVPNDDPRVENRRCMDFTRSSAVCGSGMTSIFYNKVQPREQINQLTSFIDASQVYGFSDTVSNELREISTNEGLLRDGPTFPGRKPLLPYSSGTHEMDCRKGALEEHVKCFLAGDIRANEQVGLLAMHTLWQREHNRIAKMLKVFNPHWSGDVIFHETRKIVGAQMQHITYTHWLPLIIGEKGMKKLGTFEKYDSNLNPTISNVFATAALRFGHSLINPILHRLDSAHEEIPEGNLPLHKAFFASWRIVEEGGIDPLLRGLFINPAKKKMPNQNLNSDLTEKLFHVAHAVALDLAAMNIQRSRDHAIPPYTMWRKVCNMSDVNSFEDLKNEISDANVRQKLEELYGSVHNIDVWVGGILEDTIDGGKIGPLFQCLLIEQFRRLRDGDRFWYENPDVFQNKQLLQIKKTTLARIICDNSDNIDMITDDVFTLPELQEGFFDCLDIDEMDLRMWADCTECASGFCSSTSDDLSRIRRSTMYSSALNTEYIQATPEYIEDLHRRLALLNKEFDLLEVAMAHKKVECLDGCKNNP